MAQLLLDTNIVSYVVKADSRAIAYAPHLDGNQPSIALMTLAELYRWSMQNHWGDRRLGGFLSHLTQYAVIIPDDRIAWVWAELMTIKGVPISSADAWIAATAIRHNLPLVTHNRRHFEHIPDLRIISEAP
jgi:tRNA(fMet)-specific endonuclease VapC